MNRYLVILLIITTVFSYSCMDKAESEIQVVTAEEMQEFSEINDVKLVDVSIAESQNEALLKHTQKMKVYTNAAGRCRRRPIWWATPLR